MKQLLKTFSEVVAAGKEVGGPLIFLVPPNEGARGGNCRVHVKSPGELEDRAAEALELSSDLNRGGVCIELR